MIMWFAAFLKKIFKVERFKSGLRLHLEQITLCNLFSPEIGIPVYST